MSHNQSSSPEHGFNVQCSPLVPPAMFYPLYPSSTLQNYYPNPPSLQNFMHISSLPLHFPSALYGSMPLPSASQSCVPTLRGSPPLFSIHPLDSNIIDPWALPTVQYRHPLLSPIQFPPLYLSHSANSINSPLHSRTPYQSLQYTPIHFYFLITMDHHCISIIMLCLLILFPQIHLLQQYHKMFVQLHLLLLLKAIVQYLLLKIIVLHLLLKTIILHLLMTINVLHFLSKTIVLHLPCLLLPHIQKLS